MARAKDLSRKLKTPKQVQEYLRKLPYNREKKGETLASAEAGLKRGKLHCFEAAIVAAAILEHHGYPPLVMSLSSKDLLDHVIYVFKEKGKWGSIARSRDEGLNGRAPRFRSLRDLVWSYFDPYVDKTGRIKGYQVAHLDACAPDWRDGKRNLWQAERHLNAIKHRKLKSSDARYKRLLRDYLKHGAPKKRAGWW